jgi:hypothetical protein
VAYSVSGTVSQPGARRTSVEFLREVAEQIYKTLEIKVKVRSKTRHEGTEAK